MKRRFKRKDLNAFKKILLQRRAQMTGTFDHFKGDALNGISRRDGDLSSLPSDCAELGTQIFEQSIALELLRSEADTIGQIDHAIDRIREGSFGLCEECHRPIPKARLKALPFTTLCVKCREAEERLNGF
jgi:RNA polymerase-binding protein DksA